MDTNVYIPDYYRVIERVAGGWHFKQGKLFHKSLPISIDFNDFELLYSISKQQVAIELFRLEGGKAGYYLANLREKKYYYCGNEPEDVKLKLRSLGIGRDDPMSA
ncbi:hypothetical protein VF14_08880 [Nostoc linckia z18]|uniref:Uncharacterized protein n=2 Tax=Nostoc linckia TaxID=92942 RepID=A0A9Q5ZEA1_NOSLI|nr:hypothetical protein [Nostoc linckia]PHK42558.1 hypothetical protein VF12_02525 [Nostoc linckia z15]PHK44533.1 hypothetical protein VF13_21225 [Nostoc linckia z16]PHJ59578.1 hypothetical protein VF02_24505 [Nostoc linckia z1]PHJ65144.1 hypothetical protein VF05_21645 [Nostoc linckia z3]PHJ69583.1 hypothetical protein VF03_23585 [Nostoc linckia z2]